MSLRETKRRGTELRKQQTFDSASERDFRSRQQDLVEEKRSSNCQSFEGGILEQRHSTRNSEYRDNYHAWGERGSSRDHHSARGPTSRDHRNSRDHSLGSLEGRMQHLSLPEKGKNSLQQLQQQQLQTPQQQQQQQQQLQTPQQQQQQAQGDSKERQNRREKVRKCPSDEMNDKKRLESERRQSEDWVVRQLSLQQYPDTGDSGDGYKELGSRKSSGPSTYLLPNCAEEKAVEGGGKKHSKPAEDRGVSSCRAPKSSSERVSFEQEEVNRDNQPAQTGSKWAVLRQRRKSEGTGLKNIFKFGQTPRRTSEPVGPFSTAAVALPVNPGGAGSSSVAASYLEYKPAATTSYSQQMINNSESSTVQCFCGLNSCQYCNLLLNLELTEPFY